MFWTEAAWAWRLATVAASKIVTASVGILLGVGVDVGRRLEALARGGGHAICLSRSLALALESVERGLHARVRFNVHLGGSCSGRFQGKAIGGFLFGHCSGRLFMFLGKLRVSSRGGRGMR